MADGDPHEGLREVMKQPKHPSYTTLNEVRCETRLVRVQYEQTKATGSIHLQVEVFSLVRRRIMYYIRPSTAGECPAFNALSYTWEPQLPLQDIYVNGILRRVGMNLYQFLAQLSREKGHIAPSTPWWWIDALSIDQDDTIEKEYHLPLMTLIFEACNFLFVWLGDDESINRSVAEISEHPVSIKGLAEVFRAPYFQRLWIVQEFLLPAVRDSACENTYLSCGRATIKAEALCTFVRDHGEEIGDAEWFHGAVDGATVSLIRTRMLRIRYELPSEQPLHDESPAYYGLRAKTILPLAHCIDSYSNRRCSNPHDKVAGLLGFVRRADHPHIDYEEHPLRTFMSTVLAVMNTPPWSHRHEAAIIPSCRQQRSSAERIEYLKDCWNQFSDVNATSLDRLGREMKLTDLLINELRRLLNHLGDQAHEHWKSRAAVSKKKFQDDRWLSGLLYCHQCRRVLFRRDDRGNGVWYEWFGHLETRGAKVQKYVNVEIPASGWRAAMPCWRQFWTSQVEKERLYHVSLLKELLRKKDISDTDEATIVIW